ncbi:hypothetical protein HETIRDRAFT_120386 [Heterobasidion irregulare TC 32-1]|uniref:Uncharacterized protein n=1 Tax=Heterobasidion irregulare (strain TC 32-1) TaxID=747525 RepID=W4JNN5_HETIT|nr:uncharacterized protein HETIRDRAFT_120386 [Heterobasidion irregulare TC 32-1]ETW75153.1 hypothetical protein HETIRDRAFT_120386 [Heterobasidion irregulare TC 32-1]
MPVWHKISKLRSAEGHAEREAKAARKQTLAEDRSDAECIMVRKKADDARKCSEARGGNDRTENDRHRDILRGVTPVAVKVKMEMGTVCLKANERVAVIEKVYRGPTV